jgi:hypothetical protein
MASTMKKLHAALEPYVANLENLGLASNSG